MKSVGMAMCCCAFALCSVLSWHWGDKDDAEGLVILSFAAFIWAGLR